MQKIQAKLRAGFTMLELIFVIVILGIISSIGAEIIAKIYESYILQRAQHRASVKTELAATQIANRLSYAIPGTVYRRIGATGTTVEEITSDPTGDPNDYNVLQWVGYDADSFGAITSDTNLNPGWSGFCDLNQTVGNQLSTPGSNLGLATTVISNLGGNIAGSSIFFPGYENNESNITGASGSTITLSTAPDKVVEQYKLAWTSYALEVDDEGDLYLHYNFRPTAATAVTGTTSSLLLHNVTTFKFRGDGKTIRFKICKSENIGEDFNVTACKEKAVF